MKYYVISDPHSFYTPMMRSLEAKGFFKEKKPHKLIICGDFFDRGNEPLEMQQALSDLMDAGNTILIRGNHEDLMLDLLNYLEANKGTDAVLRSHYNKNGTLATLCQLTGFSEEEVLKDPAPAISAMKQTVAYNKIYPAALDYYETSKYVFVHGWIPCPEANILLRYPHSTFNDWHNADEKDWKCARWMDYLSGIDFNVKLPDKTIVCGHRSTRYGNSGYLNIEDPDRLFDPFYYAGLIAIDATTVLSGKVNCIILEDD